MRYNEGDILIHKGTKREYKILEANNEAGNYFIRDLTLKFNVYVNDDHINKLFDVAYENVTHDADDDNVFRKHVQQFLPKHIDDELAWLSSGLMEESGELLQICRRIQYKSQIPDPNHVMGELGDVLYFITGLMDYFGYSQKEIEFRNIKKLNKRFKSGVFEIKGAIAKDDHNE